MHLKKTCFLPTRYPRSARSSTKAIGEEEGDDDDEDDDNDDAHRGTCVRMYEKERDHLYNNIVESLKGLETLRKQVREERLAASLGRTQQGTGPAGDALSAFE